MATVTYVPTRDLRVGDVIQTESSTVIVEEIKPDEWNDDHAEHYWVTTFCADGNMDAWNGTHRFRGRVEWRVLDIQR